MSHNIRITLPAASTGRELKILSAHREIPQTDLIVALIKREYETLGLDDLNDNDWKAPEAKAKRK
jgi:hypothetical protein